DVADEQRPLVLHVVGNREQVVVGPRDANGLGLRPAEPSPSGAEPQVPQAAAQGGLAPRAVPALAADVVEGDRNAVAGPEPADAVSHVLHHADGLVPERLAGPHRKLAVYRVEVGPA